MTDQYPQMLATTPEIAYLMLRTALNRFAKTPNDLDEQERADIDSQVKREYVIQSRVLAASEAQGVIVPESVVETTFAEIRGRYGDEDEFVDDLTANHLSPEGLKQAIKRELRVEAVLDRVAAGAAEISDVDVMLYYYMHPDKFRVPETRTARHILITINPLYPENTRDAAFNRISDIRKRLAKKVKRFAEQAQKHSECPTAMQGGILGRVTKGKLYAELDAVLYSLKDGEVSEVVESPLGFHIVYCEQIHEAGTLSLKESEKKIRELLEKRRRRICEKAWLKKVLQEEVADDRD